MVINNEGLSREQFIVYYDSTFNCWMIKDGKDKSSGNGTW
jgi:hypothetical protein